MGCNGSKAAKLMANIINDYHTYNMYICPNMNIITVSRTAAVKQLVIKFKDGEKKRRLQRKTCVKI